MIEMFIKLELYMKALFDTYFHFHLSLSLSFFDITIIVHNSEINLLSYCCFHIAINYSPNKISDTASNSIKSLIFFLEIRKLKSEFFIFCEKPCRLKLLG